MTKLLMVTIFYDPSVVSLEGITQVEPSSVDALFDNLEECLKQGGLMRVSRTEADLLLLACNSQDKPSGNKWLGFTFVPVPSATNSMEETAHAY
jgi:hypothetical protein